MTPRRSQAPPTPCFVHVNLDGLWTLASRHGYDEGNSFEDDPVFERALLRLLDLLEDLSIKATFFIVGRDLENPAKRRAVIEIVSRGHDLGNHGYRHVIGLKRLLYADVFQEVEWTPLAIQSVTGAQPLGLRAPGYYAGPKTLRACRDLGLAYDGSLLPTPWAPAL